jgi:iron(III) transport system permease protein
LQYAGAEIWEPLYASLVWTAIAATLAALLACALAWASRRSMAWRIVALGTLALTLATPGPVAGMGLVLAYRAFPVVYDSAAMVVLAETLRTLPYSLLILWPFLRSFPQDYLDAAALDGQGPWGQIFRVVLPLSRRPLLAAWAIAFAIGLGELPATNLAAPPGTQPMSVLIWSLLHTGVESHLSGVALIMLTVITAAGLLAMGAVQSLRAIGIE